VTDATPLKQGVGHNAKVWRYVPPWAIFTVALALLVTMAGSGREVEYCRLCGQVRSSTIIGFLRTWHPALVFHGPAEDTHLNRQLLPLVGAHHHVWVSVSSTSLAERVGVPMMFVVYRHSQQYNDLASSLLAERVETLAAADPQLAVAVSQALLYPYATADEWNAVRRRIGDSGVLYQWEPPTDENLRAWRGVVGLPVGQ
jgi:hypothetical protein